MWALSTFTVFEDLFTGVLARNIFTDAVLFLSHETKRALDHWLSNQTAVAPDGLDELIRNEILVGEDVDEFAEWRTCMLTTRNDQAHVFTLHIEPTLRCQFNCPYCFEKGVVRRQSMKLAVLRQSVDWCEEYLKINPEIDSFRLKFFGGEPLLRKDMIAQALKAYQVLCRELKIDLSVEITTNGELLDEQSAKLLARYNWHRVQITLDGPADIHDRRRCGSNGRPTYANIMKNIQMLVSTDYVPTVDIRMTLDTETKDHIARLLNELDTLNKHSRIHLSLGLTTPSLSVAPERMNQEQLAETALSIWQYAKMKGFKIPDEFTTGPLCVATAKHSAILQPDGKLQKCFCTSGRKEFDFTSIAAHPASYSQDARFEHWERTNECIEDRCAYLPICGGGCVFEAMVMYGSEQGYKQRFCQKTLLDLMNRGLLVLAYS